MDIMHSEWKVRIENWIAVLKQELYQPLGEISWTAHKTKEYLTPEQALAGDFQPVAPGYTWGDTWNTAGSRAVSRFPKAWTASASS